MPLREYRDQFGSVQNPGTYRDTISYEAPAITGQNAMGEDTVEWRPYAICRGNVEPLSGRELEAVRQRWAEAQYRITHAFISGLHREMRIAWYTQGERRYLDVLNVEAPALGRYVIVTAKDHVE